MSTPEEEANQRRHRKVAGWLDSLREADYEDVRGYTSKITGGNPALAALLTGGGLGLLGYKYGPGITRAITSGLNRVIPGASPIPNDPYQTQADISRTRRNMGLLGAALGVAPWVPSIWDAYQSGDLLGSYQEKSSSTRMPLAVKSAQNYIDSGFAKSVVNEDPHLGEQERMFTRNIFDQAEQRSPYGRLRGLVTTGDVARGAVGAGMGYTAAAVAGPLLTGLFGMPRGTLNTLKTTGGLAGALRGSGIIAPNIQQGG